MSDRNNPLLSVIMASYNTPIKFLKEAIESTLAQTYQNFELIIIDDASADDSIKYIESLEDDRIIVLKNKKNMGAAYTRNRGLDIAKGKYIAIMDSDDISEPLRFEKQVKYMNLHPNVIVCASWATIFGDKINTWFFNPKMPDMDSFKVSLLFGDNYIANPTVMMNNSLLTKYQIRYDNEYIAAEDYRFWIDCIQYGDFAILSEPLVRRRMQNKSITATKGNLQQDFKWKIIQYQLDRLHIQLTEEMKPYYNCIYSPKKLYDLRTKAIIKKIIEANSRYQVYNHKKLKDYLWDRWALISLYGMKKTDIMNKIKILFQMPINRCFLLVKEGLILIKSKKKARRS